MTKVLSMIFVSTTLMAAQAEAAGTLPFLPGTYAQKAEWCNIVRGSPDSPDNLVEAAMINISSTDVSWSETFGTVSKLSVQGNKVHMAVTLTGENENSLTELVFERISNNQFSFFNVRYVHCATYQANPWSGK